MRSRRESPTRAFTALELDVLGRRRHAAGTAYSLLGASGNIPIVYMTWLDGVAYKHAGRLGLMGIDALANGTGALLLLLFATYWGHRWLCRVPMHSSADYGTQFYKMRVFHPSEFRRNLYQALATRQNIWTMRICGLVTTGECGSRLNAVRNVDEKRESGKSTKPRDWGSMRQQRTCTPGDTARYFALHS